MLRSLICDSSKNVAKESTSDVLISQFLLKKNELNGLHATTSSLIMQVQESHGNERSCKYERAMASHQQEKATLKSRLSVSSAFVFSDRCQDQKNERNQDSRLHRVNLPYDQIFP